MTHKLTPAQARELARYTETGDRYRMGGWSLPGNPHVAAALARMGLLERMEQTEQVRGEPRATWFEYRKPRT
jgi:hypothetical protein